MAGRTLYLCYFAALDKQQANGLLCLARATEGMNQKMAFALASGRVPFACFGLSRVKLRRLLRTVLVGSGSERNIGAACRGFVLRRGDHWSPVDSVSPL